MASQQLDYTTDVTRRKIADELRRAIQSGNDAAAELLLCEWDSLAADARESDLMQEHPHDCRC